MHESLARAISIMAAALVYFGSWLANLFFGIFPPPTGVDLTHPQLLIGIASLFGALTLTRWLVRNVSLARLVRVATYTSGGLALVLGVFLALFVLSGGSPELAAIVVGLTASWLAAVIWVGLLARRASKLIARTEEVAPARGPRPGS